jgi:hypothetical protein
MKECSDALVACRGIVQLFVTNDTKKNTNVVVYETEQNLFLWSNTMNKQCGMVPKKTNILHILFEKFMNISFSFCGRLDYYFLEDVTKVKEKAEKLTREKRLIHSSVSRRRLPRSLYVLSTHARRFGINIEFLPAFMKKRKENTTRFDVAYVQRSTQ